jgi:hypothetical protein
MGYAQFCRTFLNPLLLQPLTGVSFQMWMRSSLEGIDPAHLSPLLPLRHKLGKDVFMDVVLQAWLGRRASFKPGDDQPVKQPSIPKSVIAGMVGRLKRSVAGRKRRNKGRSPWLDYEEQCPSYKPEALQHKDRFVEEALATAEPGTVWDLGCNVGKYSVMAAHHAQHVLAIDADEATVGALYERVRDRNANILPLVVDLLNPSPGQGWAHQERRALADRGGADFSLSLALVHHLAISGNVPLSRIVEWLSSIAKAGIVEFVPKSDPMVQTLLRTREDIFANYTESAFQAALEEHFQIAEVARLPESGRILYRFSST